MKKLYLITIICALTITARPAATGFDWRVIQQYITPCAHKHEHPQARKPDEIMECPICRENVAYKDTTTYECCGYRLCKTCMDRIRNLNKFCEQHDEEGTSHPAALKYADAGTSTADWNKIIQFQNATPKNNPTWTWYNINGKAYFLGHEGILWRYDQEAAKKALATLPIQEQAAQKRAAFANFWYKIEPPRCINPDCRKLELAYLEPYKI